MDFGNQQNQNHTDMESLKRQLLLIVEPSLKEKFLDGRGLYEKIKAQLGADNIDEIMLNYTINTVINELKKSQQKDEKTSPVFIDRQASLIVNSALIKIKTSDNQIGQKSLESKDLPESYGSGSDVIQLKDFKIK